MTPGRSSANVSVTTRGSHGRLCAACLVALLSSVPLPAAAQAVTGTILGTVTDPTRAVIPQASLSLVHQSTGLRRETATDADGHYVAPLLPTGVYVLRVEVPGFKVASITGIELAIDEKVRVDVALEPGALTETVLVSADNALVQRSASDISTTFVADQIEVAPLNGRNFVQLARTAPGVARGVPGENIDGAGTLGWRYSASLTANGQRTRDNNYLLDGLDNNEIWLNTVAVFPNVDALEEVKVQTGIYAAEFGRSLGAVVSLQTRSGANVFRGSAFEFLRDGRFDANDWFNNRAGRPKPDLSQHQFGGTIGGPVVRDRTFFFADYQGLRLEQDLTLVSNVPTDAMRRGDFSELNRTLYDPRTGAPFPGNVIPADRIDPVARDVIDQLYPRANAAGRRTVSGQVIDNYVNNPTQYRRDDQFDVRLDQNFGVANRAFVRFSLQDAWREIPPALPRGDGGSSVAGTYDVDARSVALNDTHVFSPAWLNELRIGWSGIDIGIERVGNDENTAESLGIPGVNVNEQTGGMVSLGLATNEIRSVGSGGGPGYANTSALQITDSVTGVKGRHTFKAGGGLILRRRHIYFATDPLGLFGHTTNLTSSCAGRAPGCVPALNSGFAFASLVLGTPDLYQRSRLEAPYTERRPEWALFVQDDVRVGARLTLNLGVRWDVFVPYVEDDDRQANFDTSTGRFVVASPDARIGGVTVGRHLQTYSKGDVAPRVGFAFDISGNGRTIIRGGFGKFWNTPLTGTASSKGQLPPFLLVQTLTNPTSFTPSLSYQSAAAQPTPQSGGTTRSSFDPNFRDGYAQQWSLNIQRQLGANYMAEIGYVGSRARQLVVIIDVNQAPASLGVTNPNVNRPFFSVNPALASVNQSQSRGTLDYHALQTRVVRRFSGGTSLSASYTFGKAIDVSSDTDGLTPFPNSYDFEYNRGPANYDVAHVFNATGLYTLPWWRDRWFGGWQVSALVLARSGYPFTVYQASSPQSSTTAAGPGTLFRPNRLDTGTVDNPTIDRWFDPEAFKSPSEPTATFGDSGRNILRGPGQFTIDAALSKLTRVGPVETEVRIEAFNLLNHPAFANPVSNITATNVGTISSLMPFTPMRQLQLGLKVRF
jgi:hypothetical protein